MHSDIPAQVQAFIDDLAALYQKHNMYVDVFDIKRICIYCDNMGCINDETWDITLATNLHYDADNGIFQTLCDGEYIATKDDYIMPFCIHDKPEGTQT